MRDPQNLLFLDLLVARFGGVGPQLHIANRPCPRQKHQPARFRRYVYASCLLLAFLAGSFLGVLIWTGSFR